MTYDSFTKASDEASSYLEQQSLASRLAETGIPLMFIDGSEDQIIDAAAVAEDFHAVPGAITKLIDGAGHSPQVEAPDETAKLILDFAGVAPPEPESSGRGEKRTGGQGRKRDRAGGGG
jgi:pimeloyl-ACP methyl ester carboxylesterase